MAVNAVVTDLPRDIVEHFMYAQVGGYCYVPYPRVCVCSCGFLTKMQIFLKLCTRVIDVIKAYYCYACMCLLPLELLSAYYGGPGGRVTFQCCRVSRNMTSRVA